MEGFSWLWFFAVAIGPVLLGLVMLYGRLRRRRLTRRERDLQHEAHEELYETGPGRRGGTGASANHNHDEMRTKRQGTNVPQEHQN